MTSPKVYHRDPFLINATELRVILGSRGRLSTSTVHEVFEHIWRRYAPEVFDSHYCAPLMSVVVKRVALGPTILQPTTSFSVFSRLAQRCVTDRISGVSFSLYHRAIYDRISDLYLYQHQPMSGLARKLAREHGILSERSVLGWFYRIVLPRMRAQEVLQCHQRRMDIGDVELKGSELELRVDARCSMYYRYMGDSSASLGWWLRGKVDGKLVARHHVFGQTHETTREIIEIKARSREQTNVHERDEELLQLLGYLCLASVTVGYLGESAMKRDMTEVGRVQVNMAASRVCSDTVVWSHWIRPRMRILLLAIQWLTLHPLAARAYFGLDQSGRNAYVDNLLEQPSRVSTLVPPRCVVPI